MGLIKAAKDAIGSMMAEQWREYFYCDALSNDILVAHKALDKAVEGAYGVVFDGDEDEIVAYLFTIYRGFRND